MLIQISNKRLSIYCVFIAMILCGSHAFGDTMKLEGSTAANLDLFVDASNPAMTTDLGIIRFYGNDSISVKTLYAFIESDIEDESNNSEDGSISFSVIVAGTSTEIFQINGNGLTLDNDMLMDGILEMEYESEPGPTWGKAKMWAALDSGRTDMWVKDSNGNVKVISPHRFELFQPSENDPIPWSYYSENCFIGKRINVDMSGAIMALEQLTGKQFIYIEDLSEEKIVNLEAWKTSETLRLINEAKQSEIKNNPWVEIPFSEAWEEVDEMVSEETLETVTKYRINWTTKSVDPYETRVKVVTLKPTGSKIEKFKAGIRFDENTGKLYRPRTLEDVVIDMDSLPEVDVSQYVKDRIYQ